MLKFQVRNNERIYQNYTSNILQYMRIYLKYSNYVIASGGGAGSAPLGPVHTRRTATEGALTLFALRQLCSLFRTTRWGDTSEVVLSRLTIKVHN